MAVGDEARSRLMARIRRSGTKPETILRRRLWAEGLRYRVDYRSEVCRVDICFPGPKLAVFVDGCFWHGCPDHYVHPRSRKEFWANKLRMNVERDRRQTMELEGRCWRVLRYWEHEVHTRLEATVEEIGAAVSGVGRGKSAPRPRWRILEVRPGSASADDLECVTQVELRRSEPSRQVRRKRTTTKW